MITRQRSRSMSSRHRLTRRITRQATELAFAVPQVVAHRVVRAAGAGHSPSARDRREFHRMTEEKVAAFNEAWTAMLAEVFRASMKAWLTPVLWPPAWTSGSRSARAQAERAMLAILTSGLAPVHRRAVANSRRLRRLPHALR
jgi:hypothetical protein